MQQIRIIGSTATGWHRVDELTAEALLRFASVEDVFYFSVGIGGATNAPPTLCGYGRCDGCPFSIMDAFIVLRMIRQLFVEVENERRNDRH